MNHTTRHSIRQWGIIFLAWLAFFAIVLYALGVHEQFGLLLRINPEMLSLAITTFVCAILLGSLSWFMLIRTLRIRIGFSKTTQILLAGNFVDNILPTIAPGGEAAMGYLLHKTANAPLSKSLASIVIYIIAWFAGFIMFTLATLGMLLYKGGISLELGVTVAFFLLVFTGFLSAIVYLALRPRKCENFITRLIDGILIPLFKAFGRNVNRNHFHEWLHSTICSFSIAFHGFLKKKTVFVVCAMAMFAYHLLYATSFYLIMLSFGINVPLEFGFITFITINLISLIAMTPGQMGVYEGLAIMTLSLSGGVVLGTLVTTVVRLVHYWSVTFVGGFFALKLGLETIIPKRRR